MRNRWSFRLIGIGLFILILLKIDLGEAWQTLRNVDLFYILLSLVFQAFGLIFATIRWQLIMQKLDIRVRFSQSFTHQLIGTAAALVTPGQLGEFVKVLYHRREGFPVPESIFSVLLDRLFDLGMLLLFGFLALAILFGVPTNFAIFLAAGALFFLVAAIIFFRYKKESGQWIGNGIAMLTPKTYKAAVKGDAIHLASRVGELKLLFLLLCVLLTVVNYSFLLLRVYALVLALQISVPFWYFAIVVPLLRLVGLIPISVLGIGTRDITAIYLFGQVGVSESSSVLISTLGLITVQFQTLVGLLAWWRDPINLRKQGIRQSERKPAIEKEAIFPGD
jgi:uncharacterized protein (TIRG00374 family)